MLLFLALAALMTAIPAFADEDRAVSEEDWMAWVSENAVQLESADYQAIDPAKLAFLDEALAGKRIVFLGEPDHYVKEKYDFRLLFIRYLFERGWTHIGMEMGINNGLQVDRYLETGDVEFLDRMIATGEMDKLRPDRDYELKDLDALENEDFKERYKKAELRFFHALRALSGGRPEGSERLHWFGYDVDLYPEGGYAEARELIADYAETSAVRAILAQMELVTGETVPEEKERIDDLLAFIEAGKMELAEILGPSVLEELQENLREINRCLQFFEAARAGPRSSRWARTMSVREEWMFGRMDRKLEQLPPDAGIILLGHNYHLSKRSQSLSFGSKDGLSRPMWKSIGTHLVETRPGETYSIWMLYDHGRRGNVMMESGYQTVESDPERIEHILARAGSMFLLPFRGTDRRESYLDETVNFVQNGRTGSGLLARQADAVFFVSVVSLPEDP